MRVVKANSFIYTHILYNTDCSDSTKFYKCCHFKSQALIFFFISYYHSPYKEVGIISEEEIQAYPELQSIYSI